MAVVGAHLHAAARVHLRRLRNLALIGGSAMALGLGGVFTVHTTTLTDARTIAGQSALVQKAVAEIGSYGVTMDVYSSRLMTVLQFSHIVCLVLEPTATTRGNDADVYVMVDLAEQRVYALNYTVLEIRYEDGPHSFPRALARHQTKLRLDQPRRDETVVTEVRKELHPAWSSVP